MSQTGELKNGNINNMANINVHYETYSSCFSNYCSKSRTEFQVIILLSIHKSLFIRKKKDILGNNYSS